MQKTNVLKPDSAAVYFDPQRRVFLLAQEAPRGRGKAETGEILEIADSEFDSRVAGALVSCLDRFHVSMYSPEKVTSRSADETRNFIRRHLAVSVERTSTGEFIIQPLHHDEGGYTGLTKEQITLTKNEVPSGIALALRKAFQMAT